MVSGETYCKARAIMGYTLLLAETNQIIPFRAGRVDATERLEH